MSNKNRKYSDEFKAKALQLLRASGRSASQLERELGISQGLLSRSRRQEEIEKAGTGYAPEEESSAFMIQTQAADYKLKVEIACC